MDAEPPSFSVLEATMSDSSEPSSVDVDVALNTLATNRLSVEEFVSARRLLTSMLRWPEALQQIFERWVTADIVRMEDTSDALSILAAVMRQFAVEHSMDLIPTLEAAFHVPSSRMRSLSLITVILQSGNPLPRNHLKALLSLLGSSLLLDTDGDIVQSSSDAYAAGWLSFVVGTRDTPVNRSDEVEFLAPALAAIGRAISWGWDGLPVPDSETVDLGGDGNAVSSILKGTSLLRSDVIYQRADHSKENSRAPNLFSLLVFSYGLYPANTLAFFKGPVSWLTSKPEILCPYASGWNNVLEETKVKQLSPAVLGTFAFNPLLASHGEDDELVDSKRLNDLDKNTLFIRCMSLHTGRTPWARARPLPTATSEESTVVVRLRQELEMQTWVAHRACQNAEAAYKAAELQRSGETERQSLHLRLKELRQQVNREQKDKAYQREQADKAKDRQNSWVQNLQEKLASLREEKKGWATEAVELRSEIVGAKNSLKAQGELLAEAQSKAFELEARIKEDSPKVERVLNFERRIDQLNRAQKLWDEDVRRYNEQKAQMDIMISNWKKLEMLLEAEKAQSASLVSLNRAQQRDLAILEAKLAEKEQVKKSSQLSPAALDYAVDIRRQLQAVQKEIPAMKKTNQLLAEENDEMRAIVETLRAEVERLQQARSLSRSRRGSSNGLDTVPPTPSINSPSLAFRPGQSAVVAPTLSIVSVARFQEEDILAPSMYP